MVCIFWMDDLSDGGAMQINCVKDP
jgi:hypothetical protein